jgi:GNAT superfamily N-acetyltransferase
MLQVGSEHAEQGPPVFRRHEMHLHVIVDDLLNRGPARLHAEPVAHFLGDHDLPLYSHSMFHGITPCPEYNPADVQRRGIGRRLVERAVDVARERGMEWVHVDYDPELHHFYERCGFQPTPAGLIRVAATVIP